MALPSTSDLVNAAHAAYYNGNGLPPNLSLLEVNGQPLTMRTDATGFFGAAFRTSSGQIIVAFEGTDLDDFEDNPLFVVSQVVADYQIYLGQTPLAYSDALSFTQTVLSAAAAQGYAQSDVFLSGHSLGAAHVQYVAAQTGLSGHSYGGPGISTNVIPAGRTSGLVNYVEYGDPVGNYSANPNREGPFLYSDQIVRYGSATYLGNPLDALQLEVAGQFFSPGSSDAARLAGAALFADAAYDHHLLVHYAADLGVTLAGASLDTNTLGPTDALRIITGILNDGTPVSGGLGADSLTGTLSTDAIRGGAGNDGMSGLAGADKIYGGRGDDTAFGNQDNDLLYGNQGADTVFGGQGFDTAYGGQGDDYLSGDRGNDLLLGNMGDDDMYGGMGSDTLFGGQGGDVIYGGQGNDVISGDLGNDILSGDLGADRFLFGLNSGADVILGFNQGDGDRIDLQGQAYSFGTPVDGSAVLNLSGGGILQLNGIAQSQVNASFFA